MGARETIGGRSQGASGTMLGTHGPLVGRLRNESRTLSDCGLVAGFCRVILDRSQGSIRRAEGALVGHSWAVGAALTEDMRGVRAVLRSVCKAFACGVRVASASRSRRVRDGFAQRALGSQLLFAKHAWDDLWALRLWGALEPSLGSRGSGFRAVFARRSHAACVCVALATSLRGVRGSFA